MIGFDSVQEVLSSSFKSCCCHGDIGEDGALVGSEQGVWRTRETRMFELEVRSTSYRLVFQIEGAPSDKSESKTMKVT